LLLACFPPSQRLPNTKLSDAPMTTPPAGREPPPRLIVNPSARGGRVGRRWSATEPELRAILGELEVTHTSGPWDAARLAEEALAAGVRTIYSLGGDGTHNEVVNGIHRSGAEPGSVTLGLLPGGTGGDFQRLMDCPRELLATARLISESEPAPVDIGIVRHHTPEGEPVERCFLNIASFGIGGLVDRYANESSKLLGGRVTFAVATFRAFCKYRAARVRLSVDGEDMGEHSIINVHVCNGRFSGGGMMFAPDARLADGLFDVLVIKDGPLIETLRFFPSVYKGEHLASPRTEMVRGKTVRAELVGDNEAWFDIDGEPGGVLPTELEVVPSFVKLLGPRSEVL
jgi:YegS/Rv2252/BmrU family lipid kinase